MTLAGNAQECSCVRSFHVSFEQWCDLVAGQFEQRHSFVHIDVKSSIVQKVQKVTGLKEGCMHLCRVAKLEMQTEVICVGGYDLAAATQCQSVVLRFQGSLQRNKPKEWVPLCSHVWIPRKVRTNLSWPLCVNTKLVSE